MIKLFKTEKSAEKNMKSMAMKHEMPLFEVSKEYNWKAQRTSDVFKFGTGGTTHSGTQGTTLTDFDGWND